MQMDEQIRVRAYELWEQAGRPTGQEQAFWFKAVAELTEAAMAAAPAKPVRKRKVASRAAA
ncbi:MAG TPA: DUF2934 domain-containing protein [Arsenicitalea sp.]|jgi:hypothetical protein|nr:DUF2934 domain-containing protein [Arsenicitalea sp.]